MPEAYPNKKEQLKEETLTLYSTGKFETREEARKKAKENIKKRKELEERRNFENKNELYKIK